MFLSSPADIVRQARKITYKKQSDFAALLGKDQSLISRYETGRTDPPGEVIMHCMHILNSANTNGTDVALDELLTAMRERLTEPAQAKVRSLLLNLLHAMT